MTAGLATGRAGPTVLRGLLGSAHLGPTVAVTVLVALLAGVVAARTAQIQQRAEDCRPAFTSAAAAAQCLDEGP